MNHVRVSTKRDLASNQPMSEALLSKDEENPETTKISKEVEEDDDVDRL